MGEIRLGKMHLRWCDSCDVPVLEQSSCGICASKTREVKLTPPGDARPAFEYDIDRIRSLVDDQFGPGTGELVVPGGRIILLNKAPDIDRMDEVIVGGEVVGASRFNLVSGERFLLRPRGAQAITPRVTRNWVTIDDVAAEAIREKSASTLAIGVIECDPDIVPGDEVIVLGPGRQAVSVGASKMPSSDMMEHKRGTAVKTRWTVERDPPELPAGRRTSWEDVVSANREVISRRVSESIQFIKKTSEQSGLPVAVSFSGGKDSLATLLLVLEADIRPSLFFVDTGLEFEETRRNVEEVAKEHSLTLLTESAGESFWTNVGFFGPPARDFRWCCKTCKLGPATRLIQNNFPGGVLSFIGQRAYESEQRANMGRMWRNPWTPNQLSASPIQKWAAMHVWIYLMSRHANVNPLYSQGFERIGCFMCPASDLAELRRAKELGREYGRWQKALEEHASRKGLHRSWLEYGVWRWKRVPRSILDELRQGGVEVAHAEPENAEAAPMEFRSTSGYGPCVEGLSMEGVFSRPLDMKRVANMLNIVGDVAVSPDGGIAEVRGMTVFAEGPVMIRGKSEQELKERASKLKEIVLRATNCAGCGICAARCKAGALRLDGRIWIDEKRCTHCGACLGPCPIVRFREDELDI